VLVDIGFLSDEPGFLEEANFLERVHSKYLDCYLFQ
jgi:hypothetical protein